MVMMTEHSESRFDLRRCVCVLARCVTLLRSSLRVVGGKGRKRRSQKYKEENRQKKSMATERRTADYASAGYAQG